MPLSRAITVSRVVRLLVSSSVSYWVSPSSWLSFVIGREIPSSTGGIKDIEDLEEVDRSPYYIKDFSHAAQFSPDRTYCIIIDCTVCIRHMGEQG
jgi:hypothetical protein